MLEQVFLKVLDMSRSAAMVIAAVCMARILLKRFPKYISYMLWSVVLFRLLCPATFETGFSPVPDLGPVFHGYSSGEDAVPAGVAGVSAGTRTGGAAGTDVPETGQAVPAQTRPEGNAGIVSARVRPEGNAGIVPVRVRPEGNAGIVSVRVCPEGNAGIVPVRIRPEENAGAANVPWQELFLLYGKYVWVSGIGVLFLYCVISTARVRKRVSVSIPLKENIYVTDEAVSPFVMGIFRPRIYLPGGLGGKEQEYIILHEKFHIRRLDHVAKPTAFAALCIHWFNPLVWVAFILFCKDMEMSCDEAVIKKLGEAVRADYAGSLLALSAKRRILRGIPVDFGEGDTKGRIKNLAAFRRTKKSVMAALVAGAAIFILCLASDRRAAVSDIDNPGAGQAFLSDAGTPGAGQVSLSDAGNPGNGQACLSDAGNPGAGQASLSDAGNPGAGQASLSDAGNPGVGQASLSGAGNPGAGSIPLPDTDGSEGGELPLSGPDGPEDGKNDARGSEAPEPLNVSLDVTEHYQTSVGDPSNLYYIDEDNVLWGSGSNQHGQLGQGTQDYEFHDEMVKIAENVIDVDYSQKGFIIFLTEDHELYGVGNAGCGALQQYSEFDWLRYVNDEHYCVAEPCLLMENVKYARCGQDDVVCLTEDGAVWVWGTIYCEGNYFSQNVLYIDNPQKVLENAVLVTGGWLNHAALLRDGTVWTWGYNTVGNCGVADLTVVGEPTMVAENVVMVWTNRALDYYPEPDAEDLVMAWTGKTGYNMDHHNIAEFDSIHPILLHNTVIRKADGSYWVCGENVGQEERIVHFATGASYSAICTHEFYPCETGLQGSESSEDGL